MNDSVYGVSRRGFTKLIGSAALWLAALAAGCTGNRAVRPSLSCDPEAEPAAEDYDYIVVGSGAGGGPLAANLARKGHRVLLVEAGGDDEGDHYRIPLFHPFASEDPAMRWDFFVRHFEDRAASGRDAKFVAGQDGVFYPRCSTLGGCTAHNAMILVYPHNEDWDYIAALTGDSTWSSETMRQYFERLENCQYVRDKLGNRGRHGFAGWLPTSLPPLDTVIGVIRDRQLRDAILETVVVALKQSIGKPLQLLKARFDPNDWRSVRLNSEGLCKMPLTTFQGRRAGPRDYIRQVQQACGGRLTVKLNTLVTRVILADEPEGSGRRHRKTVVGIEYLQGKRLYRADRDSPRDGTVESKGVIRARREVILAGGAFNTPQMLMLSGIGPKQHLREMGIRCEVELPGVGENLQDRYEVGVVTEMKQDFSLLQGVSFKSPAPGEAPDETYREWLKGEGVYATNGVVVSFIKKSTPSQPNPDLFIFGMPGYFAGYVTDYSKRIAEDQRHFTWAILKAHTNNTAGYVRLKSKDPRDRPAINFRYFDEGSDTKGEDLLGLVKGIEFVRDITSRPEMQAHIAREVIPGPAVRTSGQIAEFAKHNAWGHHASCSCRMGAEDDPMAVVDSRFRVRNVNGLRIVDASVFPRIPGFFIVSAIYMISEKAAEVIHEDASSSLSRSSMKV
jgi:choline dehydrogenase